MNRVLFLILIVCCYCSCESGEGGEKDIFAIPGLEKINREIKNHPEDAVLHFERASQLHDMGNDSLAILDLLTAVEKDSTQAKFYSAIADLHFEHKNISESVKYIQKAISIDPNDEIAHLKMAKMFFFMEEYPKAFTEINPALKRQSSFISVRSILKTRRTRLKPLPSVSNGETPSRSMARRCLRRHCSRH